MRRKKGLIIDPSDICYEEECEEIGFEEPGEIKGNLVEGFSFTNEPVQFTHTAPDTDEKPKVEKQKSKKNITDILDMRKLSIVNGLTPPIDGEKLEGDIMENLDLISLIGSTGFPIAITAYLLIRLEKQLTSLSNSINTLNTIVSVKLGAVVKDEKDKAA